MTKVVTKERMMLSGASKSARFPYPVFGPFRSKSSQGEDYDRCFWVQKMGKNTVKKRRFWTPQILSYLVVSTIVFMSYATKVESFDHDAISQVSKGIAEWKLMNDEEVQNGPQVHPSNSLRKATEEDSHRGTGTTQGLSAFNNDKPYEFLNYINRPIDNWYPVDSMGTPGGWGAKSLPGEKIYVNINDLGAWLPSWRNITPIPTYRSSIDSVYRGESGVGLTLLHIPWGPGSSQKVIGAGGHDLESYKQMASPLQVNRIRVHSQAGSALYNLYMSGGWQNIEPFQGRTILGAGVSPLDVGRNQVATGGYRSNFWGDVITRGVPWSLGSPFGNPLKVEAGIGIGKIGSEGWGTGAGTRLITPTMPKMPTLRNRW